MGMGKRMFCFISSQAVRGLIILSLWLGATALAISSPAVRVETKEGEVIVGEFADEKLMIIHRDVELGLPFPEIVEISADLDIFTLKRDIVLRGKIASENLVIRTGFGDISLPVSDIKTIKITPPAKDAWPAPGVLPVKCPHCGRYLKAKVMPEADEVGEDWKVMVKQEIISIKRGRVETGKLTLQYVERKGDEMRIGIGLRNVGEYTLKTWLPENFQESTLLLDDIVGTEHKLKAVRGIAARERLTIHPGAMRVAHFTFPFPEGVKKARLATQWLWDCARHTWARVVSAPLSISFLIPPEPPTPVIEER